MRLTSRRIGFSLALFVAGAALAATDEPQSWLDRMNHALEKEKRKIKIRIKD